MVVFGGRDGSALFNDVWSLAFSGPGAPAWSLLAVNPDPGAGVPAPRYRFAAIHETELDRWMILGGDTTQAIPSGATGELWQLTFSTPPVWRRHHETLPSGGRVGHSAVYDTRYMNATVPEIYDPSTETYTALDQAQKWMGLYPSTFLLPSGKVLYSAPTFSTYLLNLATALWETPPWSASGFTGYNSVMYRPGKILKTGGTGGFGASTTRRIDLTGNEATASWRSIAPSTPMLPRVDHNLVMLPTGDVLAAGGIQIAIHAATAVRIPQIWSPATDQWTDSLLLAPDPVRRDYHSSAILLPDGRILSAGGELKTSPSDRGRHTATVYWPPYLFDDGGALAARPQITSVDSLIEYGEIFSVCTPQAAEIAGVSLIRAASTTHGFDQEQRYVPLAFGPSMEGSCLDVTAPPNGNWAPPGWYLLFIVSQDSVPAIASWVRLGPSVSTAPKEPGVGHGLAAFPNPTRFGTTLGFHLEEPDRVKVSIYDAAGRRVRTLASGALRGAGWNRMVWDGKSDTGRIVAAGVYFARLEMSRGRRVVRFVVER
jgi:hypothetical protein